MADNQSIPPDPIRTKSLSAPIAVSTALLLAASGWALFDEGVTKRPYLEHQERFVENYREFLDLRVPAAEAKERSIKGSPEYAALKAEYDRISKEQTEAIASASNALAALKPYFDAVGFTFRDKKGKIDEYVNRVEHYVGNDAKQKDLRAELDAFKTKPFKLDVPGPDGKFASREYTAQSLIDEFLEKKAEQGALQGALGRASQPVQAAKKKLDDFLARRLGGLSAKQLDDIHAGLAKFEYGIKQIHVGDINLVDRCESCHLGAREAVDIHPAEIGTPLFASHPNRDLLAIHDPERFGCSLCHGGNGIAVTSAEKGHGKYKHWLWPLHDMENVDAGCVACHTKDVALDHGDTFNRGKHLFKWRGCWGCHKYEGFDVEADQLTTINKELLDIAAQERKVRASIENRPEAAKALNAAFTARIKALEDAEASDEAIDAVKAEKAAAEARLGAQGAGDAQTLVALAVSKDGKNKRRGELYQEMKKVGPNLKEVRHKLRPEWIPAWLEAPEKFRPDTKMPSFADVLTENQRKAISAFLWAQGLPTEGPDAVPLQKHAPGDATVGKRLFEARGCTACHAVGEGADAVGGDFAANLTRVGEKANYDYLVHWVQHPRNRLAPYSLDQKKDLLPSDYAKAGKPYAWEMEGSTDPSTGGQLVAHNYTVMPSLRLSDQDARDIASYLLTLKSDATYAAAEWMTNPSKELIEEGVKWTRHFGCAGCHEIRGFEDEQRIGVELTVEGSKPMERLDFGLLTHEAKYPERADVHPYPEGRDASDRKAGVHASPLPGWYDHKGFFMNKLKDPQIYDLGKERAVEDLAALKMPNFRLEDSDRVALTTFLLGSVETNPRLKERGYFHEPKGADRAIQEGWWIVKKYNCQACHSFQPGELPELWTQSNFAKTGVTWKAPSGEEFKYGQPSRPPTVVGQGFRTDPQWLAEFLRNPALSRTHVHRNGVRPYLNVRMPTFHLSENEIQKLVAFFAALSDQPMPYVKPEYKPLSTQDVAAAEAYYPNCARCHQKGDDYDPTATAPSFSITSRRLNPEWVRRWVQDPQSLSQGTLMPVWFKEGADGHWRFNGSTGVAAFDAWQGDQIDLLVRYLDDLATYQKK
jgi:cytochrome c2